MVRPIEPGDKRRLEIGLEAMSEESRYKRFGSPAPRLTPGQLAYFTEVDHHDHEALIAAEEGWAGPVGVGRYVRSESARDEAEVAFAVVDPWQNRGVATALSERLIEHARAEGIRFFTATVLASNDRVVASLRRAGWIVADREPGLVNLRLELPGPEAPAALGRALRAAATGELEGQVESAAGGAQDLGGEERHDEGERE